MKVPPELYTLNYECIKVQVDFYGLLRYNFLVIKTIKKYIK